MNNINSITLTGHLTKDAEIKRVGKNGKSLLSFSLANNTGFGTYAKTQFFDCVVFGDTRVTALEPMMIKGTHVGVTGAIEANNWIQQDGTQRTSWQIRVSEVTLMGNKTPAPTQSIGELFDTVRNGQKELYEGGF